MSSPHRLGPNALLLEDEMLIALDFEDALLAQGFTSVMTFAEVQHARTWLETETPGVAIIDLHLRDGSSLELVGTLKSRGVPIIICSGERGDNFPVEVQNFPSFEKPCDSEKVAQMALSLVFRPAISAKPDADTTDVA
ncbi:response regulator [Aquibium sp. LZ166]|uniref:Response regulator n=1 Tax=Aquibium pacificus TaxID=3153579 RepID=A0ABV3SJ37_9HYPH